ncbi:MAG: hypothetical protein ACLU6O_13490 [Bilophila wadsworthia]
MQKDFLHVLPVEEVISRLLDVSPLPQESKRLDKLSGGPILAETIMATETLPPANRSGMDGYAVQASDLFGPEANPVWLDCVGESPSTGAQLHAPIRQLRYRDGLPSRRSGCRHYGRAYQAVRRWRH